MEQDGIINSAERLVDLMTEALLDYRLVETELSEDDATALVEVAINTFNSEHFGFQIRDLNIDQDVATLKLYAEYNSGGMGSAGVELCCNIKNGENEGDIAVEDGYTLKIKGCGRVTEQDLKVIKELTEGLLNEPNETITTVLLQLMGFRSVNFEDFETFLRFRDDHLIIRILGR